MLNNNQELDKIISNAIIDFENIKTNWDDSIQKIFYEQHIAPLITILRQIKDESESIYHDFFKLKEEVDRMQFH